MRLTLCTAIASVLAAGSAFAAQAPASSPTAKPAEAAPPAAKPSRTVFICDNDAMTRRAFAREYGKTEFVRAEAAAAKGEAWSAPRCITAAEARKLKRELASK